MRIADVVDWFAGGSTPYMRLTCCMRYDWPWIALTIGLTAGVGVGYVLIALHWWESQRSLAIPGPARLALGRLRNIFILCGTCGYLFVIVKMFWPAWRLYDIALMALVVVTWRYRWGVRNLKVIYQELNRSRRLAESLEESRSESRRKSFFLSALSHDLRTPLNGLSLHAELADLAIREGDAEEATRALAEIRGLALASAEMLNRFLEMGRLDWSADMVHPGAVGPVDLARDVARTLEPDAARKGLAVTVVGDPATTIRTDRALLERILANLVANAIKFTAAGSVEVRVRRASGGGVEIGVIDTGIGIEPAELGRLFDEFYQVHNRERDRDKGFGLGLAIARRLARRLGGELSVESEPGRGSRFTVALPASCPDLDDDLVGGGDRRAVAASPAPAG